MATPIKDLESAFWAWLQTAVTLPAELKIYRSYDGAPMPFAASEEAFQDPRHMPAIWLVPGEMPSEFAGLNTVVYQTAFEGGLAMAVPPNLPARDTFEATVTAIQRAIYGRMTRDVPGIQIHELTKERIRAQRAGGIHGPVIGYVWTFTLRMGLTSVAFP